MQDFNVQPNSSRGNYLITLVNFCYIMSHTSSGTYSRELGHDPFDQNSDRSDRKKRTTSKGGPVFSKLFRLDRTDPLSFGPKFPESLVEWIAPLVFCAVHIVKKLKEHKFVFCFIFLFTLLWQLICSWLQHQKLWFAASYSCENC